MLALGKDDNVEDIEEVGQLDRRPFIDRYYLKKYVLNPTPNGEDLMMLVHSNKLVILTLAMSHPIVKLNLTILAVNFKISAELNRAQNRVSGKGKKGAQLLSPKSPICTIESSCGKSFLVKASLSSKLLEVNENLRTEPEILKKEGHGFIAILSPRASDFEEQLKTFLSEEEYEAKLKERTQE